AVDEAVDSRPLVHARRQTVAVRRLRAGGVVGVNSAGTVVVLFLDVSAEDIPADLSSKGWLVSMKEPTPTGSFDVTACRGRGPAPSSRARAGRGSAGGRGSLRCRSRLLQGRRPARRGGVGRAGRRRSPL